ncbi:beta subunit of citrate lyase [Fusarium sp. MPI-SDFR-AT-0072]|nr:beta subunit of citrate lyase [Fusarium sp. MPI-SDFR-AT-0072]
MTRVPSLFRRAILYVPGASQKMPATTQALAVDSVIYDLEDSVALDLKATARGLVARHLSCNSMSSTSRAPKEVAVRINAVDTALALEDLSKVLKQGKHVDTIVVPKVQGPADLHFVADVVRHFAPHLYDADSRPLNILALIESARGLSDINSICRAAPLTDLSGIAFAAEDFTTELAHSIPSLIDLVSTDVPLDDVSREALQRDSQEGRALGFIGKQPIHPPQIDLVQRAFGPSTESLKLVVRVLDGHEKAKLEGKRAWELDGKMIDAPIVNRAQELIERARSCGINVSKFKEAV